MLDPGQRWPRPAHQARVVLDHRATGRGGLLARHRRAASSATREDDVVGHLGPDLLGPDWDADEAVRRLAGRARPAGPRRPARPAQPGRHRQHVRRRAVLRRRRAPARPRSAAVPDLRRLVAARPPDARPQQGARVPVHDRRPARARADLGLPPRPVALPALRHPGRSWTMQGPVGRERASYWCPSLPAGYRDSVRGAS